VRIVVDLDPPRRRCEAEGGGERPPVSVSSELWSYDVVLGSAGASA